LDRFIEECLFWILFAAKCVEAIGYLELLRRDSCGKPFIWSDDWKSVLHIKKKITNSQSLLVDEAPSNMYKTNAYD